MSLFDMTGKVALITGSSRGIGKAIAVRMAEHGARIVVSSRKADACEAVAREIVAAGGQALVQPCNISRKEDIQSLVDATLAKWGRIDVLVCNAAVNVHFGPAATATDDMYDKIMNANVRSNFWMTNRVAPIMAKQKDGAIVIISSVAGLQGNDVLGIYGISKAADMQLARNLALEWGPSNVRANCIAPGLIKTDMAKALWENPEIYARTVKAYPLRRIGVTDEIAGAAVMLGSKAGAFITGQTIVIDGGGMISRGAGE